MENILNDTENLAYNYLGKLGFTRIQIEPLIVLGLTDIRSTIEKLYSLIERPQPSIENLNHLLHTLKGLFLQMGNHVLAEKINQINQEISQESILEINTLFFSK